MTDSFSYDPYGDSDANNVPDGGQGEDTTAGDGLPGYPLSGAPDWRAGVPGVTNNVLGMARVSEFEGQPEPAAAAKPLPASAHGGIDWGFVHAHENPRGSDLSIYVPVDKQHQVVGHSGPTIGYGFDVGQHSADDLRQLGLSQSIVNMLSPYLNRQGEAARTYVKAHPLTMARVDVDAINQAVQAKNAADLAGQFDAASKVGSFGNLPSNTQTAITDLYHQYGLGNPARSTPAFWRQITAGDWQGAYGNLQNFKDHYGTRRSDEADLLKRDIDAGILPSGPGR